MKRGHPGLVPSVHFGTGLDQKLDDVDTAGPGGSMQCGVPVVVSYIRIGPRVQEGLHQHWRLVLGGLVQRRQPRTTPSAGIRTGCQQLQGEVGYRVGNGVGSGRGGATRKGKSERFQQWGVTAFVNGVDICARFEQGLDEGDRDLVAFLH